MKVDQVAAITRPQDAQELRAIFGRLRTAGEALARLPLARLLEPLDRLAGYWAPGRPHYNQACDQLAGAFCRRAVEAALQSLAFGLTAPVLQAELRRELGRADLLDAWQTDELGAGLVRGYPLGVTAQVLAGNVFLGGVVALAQSLLTRNAVLLKLSREDSGFTALFADTLHRADNDGVLTGAVAVCAWDSSQEEFNEVVRAEADAVVIWGGAAAVAAYPVDRCRGRVIHYGPRLGIGLVLEGVDLAQALPALAWDVALWEQRACSSPRLLLVEDRGPGNLPRQVAAGLSEALCKVRATLPARPLSLDEKAEVLSLRELAWWADHAEVRAEPGSMAQTVLLTSALPHEIPLGYRTVLVVPVRKVEAVPGALGPYRDVLQTAVLVAPPRRWPEGVEALVRAGLSQVTAPGAASARVVGLPHEGEYALRRLVRLVGIDLGAGPLTYPRRAPAGLADVAAALAAGQ
jgi:long-chain-fatty-acyl-CoA reductase